MPKRLKSNCLYVIFLSTLFLTTILISADEEKPIIKKPVFENLNEMQSPEIIAMTEIALKYLAENQSEDGSWHERSDAGNSGVTALCCLAFMAEGSRPRNGKYAKILEKGFDYLLSKVSEDGAFALASSNPLGPMYEHFYTCMALLMVYKDMPWKPEIKDVLEKALKIFETCQKIDGGWRYDLHKEGYSDMSVTGNVLWLLSTAQKIGFTISEVAIKRGLGYIEKCVYPDGTFRYRYFGLHPSVSLGGLGLIAFNYNGKLDHLSLNSTRDHLANDYNKLKVDELRNRRYFIYGCFYASIGMFGMGENFWNPWFLKASQVLKVIQEKDGSFKDEFDNSKYTTAMAAIILQAPKGKLSIYAR